jgi:hypothetical protein
LVTLPDREPQPFFNASNTVPAVSNSGRIVG